MAQKKVSNTRTVVSQKSLGQREVKVASGDGVKISSKLSSKEIEARKMKKYATTTFGMNSKNAYSSYGGSGVSSSQFGNFYSPQLSTDFLEKPQNLRERRAWYRHFYNANEFVGQAIDLHSTIPLSKIRLEKPKGKNQDQVDYMYSFFVEMCDEIKLFKTLMEISHDFWLLGEVFCFAEDHEPYKVSSEDDQTEQDRISELKEFGKIESARLYKEFEVIDRDPNYKGWQKLIILPPDQVRIRKIPLSDESIIEFIPDPETRKSILNAQNPAMSEYDPAYEHYYDQHRKSQVPTKLLNDLQKSGSIPMDTDPFSGSHVCQIARKKSQYETHGVSILERCVNTLLLWDKLRQSQTSIASRHMTPIRIVWAEELNEADVENLREQVDMALVDPDFSIVANYQVNWEEMGSNGRLLELSTEYDHIENSLFAGLGVTREILTGEGTYAGNRISLEILNTQYLLFRELLQEYVENNLFKPVSKKKGFIEKDKYGRDKVLYPKLSFTRLAIRDNDTYFDQAMQLYSKGSISIDIILDMLNVDPESTKKKIEADLFTVNDFAFNQLMSNLYVAASTSLVEKYGVSQKIAEYLKLQELEQVQPEEGGNIGAPGGIGAEMARFSSDKSETDSGMDVVHKGARKVALEKITELAAKNPKILDRIVKYFQEHQ